MQSINLTITAERVKDLSDTATPYAGVIKNGGLNWWVSSGRFRTMHEAEEVARLRALALLDDMRTS